MPIPSWSTEIQPIVNRTCKPCHFPGGQAVLQGPYDFETYAGFLHVGSSTIRSQLRSCKMPQAGGDEPLSTADGDAILNWLVCGAPNN